MRGLFKTTEPGLAKQMRNIISTVLSLPQMPTTRKKSRDPRTEGRK